MNASSMLRLAMQDLLAITVGSAGLVTKRKTSQMPALPGPLVDSLLSVNRKLPGEEFRYTTKHLGGQPSMWRRVVQVLRNGNESDIVLTQNTEGIQHHP